MLPTTHRRLNANMEKDRIRRLCEFFDRSGSNAFCLIPYVCINLDMVGWHMWCIIPTCILSLVSISTSIWIGVVAAHVYHSQGKSRQQSIRMNIAAAEWMNSHNLLQLNIHEPKDNPSLSSNLKKFDWHMGGA